MRRKKGYNEFLLHSQTFFPFWDPTHTNEAQYFENLALLFPFASQALRYATSLRCAIYTYTQQGYHELRQSLDRERKIMAAAMAPPEPKGGVNDGMNSLIMQ